MSSSRTFPSFWSLHLSGWAALGLAMWISLLPYAESYSHSFVNRLLFILVGGTITLGLRPLYRHLHERDVSIPALIGISIVCSCVVGFGWGITYTGGTDLLWEWIHGKPLTISSFLKLNRGTFYCTFISMAWSVLYFGVKYYQDAQAERERALAAEGLAHKARLQALRYQLNPHFLFNTLNAVSTLIVERENRDAERMVARLSDFLRLTLECDSDIEVPLADELDFARRYLDIEQIRLGDRLEIREDIDPDTLSARVPPLLLQPLIENAVRHGVMPREEGGQLTLEARRVGDRLLLRVADDGPGLPETPEGTGEEGLGLSNTKARIEALYGTDYDLSLRRADGGGCAVRIELPFRTSPETGPHSVDLDEITSDAPRPAPSS